MDNYIVMVGYAGFLGTKKILQAHYKELEAVIGSRYLDSLVNKKNSHSRYNSPYFNERAAEEFEIDEKLVCYNDLIKCSSGGVIRAIFDYARENKCGFRLLEKNIPLIQVSVEICEYFDLDIYRMLTDAWLFITDEPSLIIDILSDKNFEASIIGKLTKSLDKIIVDREHIEYVNRTTIDEVDRL